MHIADTVALHLAQIADTFVGEQVHADTFLHDHIAAVSVVAQNVCDGRYGPMRLTCRTGNALFRQYLCNFIRRLPTKVERKDSDDNTSFLFIDDKCVVHALIPIGLDQLRDAFRKALPDTPSDTDGFIDALVLRKCRENG